MRINVDNRRLPGVQSERVEVPLPRPKGNGLTVDVHSEAVYLDDKLVGEIRYLARRRTTRRELRLLSRDQGEGHDG